LFSTLRKKDSVFRAQSWPGCWSEGSTEQEALENIQDAIREYLASVAESTSALLVREVKVSV
jgi:predicted RNase H-like HicB family nuclease